MTKRKSILKGNPLTVVRDSDLGQALAIQGPHSCVLCIVVDGMAESNNISTLGFRLQTVGILDRLGDTEVGRMCCFYLLIKEYVLRVYMLFCR